MQTPEEKQLVLHIGQTVLCIKDCWQDYDDLDPDDELVWLYKKGREYTATKQGFLIDEQGFQRQWKTGWFTLSRDFYKYFKLI